MKIEDSQFSSLDEARHALVNLLNTELTVKTDRANEAACNIADSLFDKANHEVIRGHVPANALALQNEVLGMIAVEPSFKELRMDHVFNRFMRRMCVVAARELNWDSETIKQNPQLTESFIEHLKAHYQILKELEVPPSYIGYHIHRFSPVEVEKILIDLKELQQTPDHKIFRRASGILLGEIFKGKYHSVADATARYKIIFNVAVNEFEKTAPKLVPVIADAVFRGQYKSVAAAKRKYIELTNAAYQTFEPSTRRTLLSKYVASAIMKGRLTSVGHAKHIYDAIARKIELQNAPKKLSSTALREFATDKFLTRGLPNEQRKKSSQGRNSPF